MIQSSKINACISSCPADWLQQKITIISSALLAKSHIPPFSCDAPALLVMADGADIATVQAVLGTIYPSDFSVMLKKEGGSDLVGTSLNLIHDFPSIEALYLPTLDAEGTSEFFQEVVAHLRAPDGCPWDREQTHESLRPFLLEESYEMLDALDRGDLQGVKEELGDVLLQIYLHAQIASENGDFSIREIIASVGQKMIRRHPHVFAAVDVNGDVGQVLRNWQDIKEAERRDNGEAVTKGMLDGVPNSMSALLQAQTYQGRAAAVGFDWGDIESVLQMVEEEVAEVRQAASPTERASEVGDLLFALVNLVRWLNLDAESVLRNANHKFARRFGYVEQQSRAAGMSLNDMTLEEMDQFWDEAKALGM